MAHDKNGLYNQNSKKIKLIQLTIFDIWFWWKWDFIFKTSVFKYLKRKIDSLFLTFLKLHIETLIESQCPMRKFSIYIKSSNLLLCPFGLHILFLTNGDLHAIIQGGLIAVGRGEESILNQNKSQEATTTTSNTILLVNLGTSFTQMT